MDHLQKFNAQVRNHLTAILLANNVFMLAAGWYTFEVRHFDSRATLLVLALTGAVLTTGFVILSTRYLTAPLRTVWQAILHIAPETADQPAPNLKHLVLGREAVTNLVSHIYQLASVVDIIQQTSQKEQFDPKHDFVASSLPLPLIILDKADIIMFANQEMLAYIKKEADEVIGKNFYTIIDMSFPNENTFDKWLTYAKANKPVASQTWERVRLNTETNEEASTPQFDLAAYYNQDNPGNLETMVVFFDHTTQYAQDDQAMSFVALAVHELRTPLTLLRGYIEAFDEELHGRLTPELDDFMKKMAVSAQQLSTFINTILNVSRIENDQFELQLNRESWQDILIKTVDDLRLRAEVRGIALELDLPPQLPAVGVDRVSIYEVVSNLVDNAIKYSGDSKKIVIKAYQNREGLVETTIQDYGVGIPASAIGHIFDKFYRNHRNRSQIGGTGLGLYLAKAIIGAHGGQIWVSSHEGQGSTFGFTVLPYSQVAEELKNRNNSPKDIVRSAHGWIKNHSLYRR
jgi:signal transduction histidine kinase